MLSVYIHFRQTIHTLCFNMPSEDESSPVRKPYTFNEDVEILAHIIENDGFDKVKGVIFWISVEKAFSKNGCKRTWQSLKERFRRTIIPNIGQYDLDDETKAQLLVPFNSEQTKQPVKKVKGTGYRRPYTLAEDKALARYVLRSTQGDVRGNIIWKDLEKEQIVKGRSWMSMRSRFLNYVSGHLFEILNSEDAKAVQRIIRGDLPFVDYCSSGEEDRRSTVKKKRSCRTHKSLKQADSLLPSTSRGLPSRPLTSVVVDSDSNDSTPARPCKKIPRVIESEEELSDLSVSPTLLRKEIGPDPPLNSSVCSMPIVLLQRCDAVRDNHDETGSSQSTLFIARTDHVKNECCCDDWDPSSRDPSAFCSSQCRTLVGRPIPMRVRTAEAMLRSDQIIQKDDLVLELTSSSDNSQGSKRVQSVTKCLEADHAFRTAPMQMTDSVRPLGSRKCSETSLPSSKDIKKSRWTPRRRKMASESNKALLPLEEKTRFQVNADRDRSLESEGDDMETPVENMIDYLASIDDSDEPETFVDPLNGVMGANTIVIDGTSVSFGIPKFPVLNFL